MRFSRYSQRALPLWLLSTLPVSVLGGDVLSTDGYSTCLDNPSIQVTAMNIEYDRATNKVVFDVAGSSSEVQNVSASIVVTAYGKMVYQKNFDPCSAVTYVKQLCPGKSETCAAAVALYSLLLQSPLVSSPLLDHRTFHRIMPQ